MTELKKGYFPHLSNKEENQTYVGPFPDIHYYSPDTMSGATRTDFLAWYNSQEGQQFDFQHEMLTYCRSDVDILRRCCLEFRNEFIKITDVDPFCYVIIASTCMATYRSKRLEKETIAMVPVREYKNYTNFSPDAMRWLDFIATKENIFIEHTLNRKGERKIDDITVEGFCEETNTVHQFHGCFYYGYPDCFEGDTLNSLTGATMKTLFERTANTTARLRNRGYTDRLNLRDAFHGGRTNAVKLYFEGKAKYADFTSLYPWVNKYCLYPVGHPEIITENFVNIESYFGLIQCRVLPPRGLYLPVLPLPGNGKLMFSLCRCCTENLNQSPCEHSDEERSMIGTWITEENKSIAVQKGYRFKDVYLPKPEVAAIVWDSKKDFIPQDTRTNIFLAAFTTTWARLKLYSEMNKLGEAVLYHDTDSIIYASNGKNAPPLGNFLGEFTDELDVEFITTFISGKHDSCHPKKPLYKKHLFYTCFFFAGGLKNYAYRTSQSKTCCKVRGFTLNFQNNQTLNFESIKHLICSLDRNAIIPLNDAAKITRDAKRRKVFNVLQTKLYRIVYDKRVIKEDFSTMPYGY
ncbi:hypothetical protein AVEN_91282-1 [Araneus ventricosus]|uniref:DNA-directed DNA polymerase n=1 Tax=Araneus ventricosus TaxID=182803 RepID=A0A4Y2EPX8_ARAVE|nr:hypothetical protein AVEN_91282-1 [Araneus ventricosus]